MAKFSMIFGSSRGKGPLTDLLTILLSVVEGKENTPERICLCLKYIRGSINDC